MNLRYTALPEVIPRTELPDGRRLHSGGILSGALHTLGYYSTDVCIGSPGRKFDLIIDTGSSVTAVPCASCKACGVHRCGITGRFNPQRSSSSSIIDCRSPPQGFTCERCDQARCGYSVHYTEGSSIKGHVMTDLAHFTRTPPVTHAGAAPAPPIPISTRIFFGCQTLETGMFNRQEADGIVGLQPPRARARVPSVLTSLLAEHKGDAAESFSLCLSDRSGLFLLGGRTDARVLRARGALTLPMDKSARARYTLRLADVQVSAAGRGNGTFRSLGLPLSTYSPTVVDSGTTFVYASTPLFKALHAHLQSQTRQLAREGNKLCAHLTPNALGAMPSLRFYFAGTSQPLLIRPHQYMVEFPKRSMTPGRHLCAAIFDNQRGGTVIGASIMRQREVIFNIAESSITFVDSDCDSITPSRSLMQGAFAFAPCPPTNTTNAGGSTPALTRAGGPLLHLRDRVRSHARLQTRGLPGTLTSSPRGTVGHSRARLANRDNAQRVDMVGNAQADPTIERLETMRARVFSRLRAGKSLTQRAAQRLL